LPLDLIPDVIPVLGFTDDGALLALAVKSVSSNIKESHREKAREKLKVKK
jgi:uncharacterized membrane protein YkvA (DUF1232 family)